MTLTVSNDTSDPPSQATVRTADYTDFIRGLGPADFRRELDLDTNELRVTFPCPCGTARAARYPSRHERRRLRKLPADDRSRGHRCHVRLADLEQPPNAVLFQLRLSDQRIPRAWAE